MSPPPTVLLADHHPDELPDLGSIGLRARLVHTRNLVDTVRALALERPEVLVVQPLTQRPGGFELEQVLGAVREQNPPPLILLVVRDTPSLAEQEAGDSGVDDFLLRPLDPLELAVRIRLALERSARLGQLRAQNRDLERECITDFKTGLRNDRFFSERLKQEVARSRRHGSPLSLAMFDFDDFKRINDDFDHGFGDLALATFARKLREVIRQTDVAARVGGDEFALLLPDTDLEEATRFASRLRRELSGLSIQDGERSTTLALSIGLDSLDGELEDPAEFRRRADCALLEAKRRGKNRICLYRELPVA